MKTACGEELVYKKYHKFTLPVTETFAYYERNGYEGCDVDLEISLREYNLIWGKNKCCEKDEYHFIYYVGDSQYQDDNGEFHTFPTYAHSYMTKEDLKNMVLEYGWFDWDRFSSYIGYLGTAEKWIKEFIDEQFPMMVMDAILYYGAENILGTAYDKFPIIKYGEYVNASK